MGRAAMLLAALLAAGPVLAPVHAQEGAGGGPGGPSRVITMTGTGEASAVPDRATLRLGVVTRAASAAEAVAANADAASRLIDALRGAGIAPDGLQTSGLSVRPPGDPGRGASAGERDFVAMNGVVAEIAEIARVGAILDAAVAAGANRIDGLSFTVADPAPLAEAALARAVADALAKARVAAEAAGLALGPVLSIADGAGGPSPRGGPVMALEAAGAGTPIEAGQVTLRRSVTVSWTLSEAPSGD